MKSKIIAATATFLAAGGTTGAIIYGVYTDEQAWNRECDGISITSKCTADEGTRYTKYVFHEAEPERKEIIEHPAEEAITRIEHHDAVYGTRRVNKGCIQTSISYKHGTCALSRCRDGSYSGSTGWGTCNYHGGVAYGGGPWYIYEDEQYIVTPAWDEEIIVVPAKEAWEEEVVVSPAREAYYEKVAA